MKTSTPMKAGLILLLLFSIGAIAVVSANNGGYIVTPLLEEYPEGAIVDNGEAEETITFLDLPLWIQISFISGMLVPSIALVKYLPLALGKVIVKKDSPTYQDINSYIAKNPGCIESEIYKNLGITRGTLRHYLRRMKSEQLIFTLPKGRIKGIFQFDFLKSNGEGTFYLHLKNDTRKTILHLIEENPGITGKELTAKLRLDKSTIHWHLKDLSTGNVVYSQRDGRFKRYYLRERTHSL